MSQYVIRGHVTLVNLANLIGDSVSKRPPLGQSKRRVARGPDQEHDPTLMLERALPLSERSTFCVTIARNTSLIVTV
eukprot:722644-Prymnesium_polylepis.1